MVQNVFGFCQKKFGRVNPGAGIYDPPENNRVKIVELLLVVLKENFRFCPKKLGRVNPGAGNYDPPPQKIVGLKLCGIVVSCLKIKFLFQ